MKIRLPFTVRRPVLAFGTQGKNTLCFASGRTARLSPIHPEISSPEGFFAFKRSASAFLKDKPRILAYDLHPGYLPTSFALSLRGTFLHRGIQHHHAHIAACMAENGLSNHKIIGVAFDGTGMGLDASIWGAEFLICDYAHFRRAASLRQIPLLGMEMAIRQPWRALAAWLYSAYGEDFLKLRFNAVKKIKQGDWLILRKMYHAGFASPQASSMGRLFDAIACLVLDKASGGAEGELPRLLEQKAASCTEHLPPYSCVLKYKNGFYEIDPRILLKSLVRDLLKGKSPASVAHAAHAGIAAALLKTCVVLRKETGLKAVALSGGVFQNNLLRGMAEGLLRGRGFTVHTHRLTSCSDAGVSLGQAAVAHFGG